MANPKTKFTSVVKGTPDIELRRRSEEESKQLKPLSNKSFYNKNQPQLPPEGKAMCPKPLLPLGKECCLYASGERSVHPFGDASVQFIMLSGAWA